MTGCKKEADTTSITGEIKGLGNDTIYLYGVDGLYEQIDTICVKGDKFSHSLKIDTITSAVLLFKKNTEYPIFLDKKNKIKKNRINEIFNIKYYKNKSLLMFT